MKPTPEQIKEVRKKHNLTQTQSARLIHSKLRTWQDWESGKAKMHEGLWELYLVKLMYEKVRDC